MNEEWRTTMTRYIERARFTMFRFVFAAFAAVASCLPYSAVSAFSGEEKYSVGFLALAPDEQMGTPPMGVWYPSTSPEVTGKLGHFPATWAWGGEAAEPGERGFPVIVFSHGGTGRYRNHRQTAAALARGGYVVVAPDHLSDRLMTSKAEIIAVVTTRVEEINIALAVLAAHPLMGKISDTSRIGALGYSLGTASVLYAAGATPEMRRFARHCRLHRAEDPNFCGGGWLSGVFDAVASLLAYLKDKGILRPKTDAGGVAGEEFPTAEAMESPAFSAIALVAPVGAPFSAETLRRLPGDVAVALFRLGDDDELRSPYHAEYLRAALGDKAQVSKTYAGVHHHAFISPFPKRLLEEEHIPVAIDPEGFDRAGFIRRINAHIVEFFDTHL